MLAAFKKTNQNTQEVKINMNAFYFGHDKRMFTFSAYVAFSKATNGQTDINHDGGMIKMLLELN